MSGSPPELSRPLVGLLDYLRDLGFEDLYRPARDASAVAGTSGAPVGERSARRAMEPRTPAASVATRPEGGAPRSAGSDLDTAERARRLATLCDKVSGCTDCGLSERRNSVVFGVGDPDADLMFIGEGPGAEEDRQGIPFVGRAGELLTKIIAAIGLERAEVYIANIVKCRPPGNRDPQPDEVAACRGYLEQQIDLVRPKVIVALGRVAAQTLLGESTPLGRMRGHWYQVRGVETRVTYHPAALLRNVGFKRPTWEDMQVVRDRLAELQAESGPAEPVE